MTVRSIGAEAGLLSSATVHFHLKRLRDLGLVAWEEGRRGTLRPTVMAVAYG